VVALCPTDVGGTRQHTRPEYQESKIQKISESQSTRRHIRRLARTRVTRTSVHTRRRRYHERFFTSSFANDIVEADMTAGEDPIVRQAAIDALGNMNGTVVAIQPTSGRYWPW